jgi:site-specific recombinase XerD
MKYRATQRAYQRFLTSQGRLAVVSAKDTFAEIRHKYRQELIDVRGLSSETVAQHERTIGEFLSQPRSRETLRSLTSSHIEDYLALKGQTVGRHRLQHVIAHLRSFLGFCRANGEFERPLEVIDSVRIHRDELPPKALPWPLVQALLRSIECSSRSGWRDYTILYLAAHYGLRPSEIVSLRLDSINWGEGTLKVEQRKTRSILLLPLAGRTISILRRYLQHGRPNSSHPQLFLRARCPAGALMSYAITDIFATRVARSGLSIKGYSVYSLRHAFAMRLLQRGVGVKTIGDLLGHQHLASTCQYLRLELEMLRGVALPVPGRARGGVSP